MGTAIYGSYDELVFELSIGDRYRNGTAVRTHRVKVDDIVRVHAADPADLVSWDGERVLRIGRLWRGELAVVLEVAAQKPGSYDRILIASKDAEDAVAGLQRSGIGGRVPVAA